MLHLELVMAKFNVRKRNANAEILSRIQQAYSDWDADLGPDIWKVAKQWLQDKGVQVE